MKQPNPERLVVTDGIPITVHSAVGVGEREKYKLDFVSYERGFAIVF